MQITKDSDEELLFFPLTLVENPPIYLIFAHWMYSVTLISSFLITINYFKSLTFWFGAALKCHVRFS